MRMPRKPQRDLRCGSLAPQAEPLGFWGFNNPLNPKPQNPPLPNLSTPKAAVKAWGCGTMNRKASDLGCPTQMVLGSTLQREFQRPQACLEGSYTYTYTCTYKYK